LGVSHVFLGEIERGVSRLPIARIADVSRITKIPERSLYEARGDCLACHGTGRAQGAA
jgi:hypothetical protein